VREGVPVQLRVTHQTGGTYVASPSATMRATPAAPMVASSPK
jgi:hypothetical protein